MANICFKIYSVFGISTKTLYISRLKFAFQKQISISDIISEMHDTSNNICKYYQILA